MKTHDEMDSFCGCLLCQWGVQKDIEDVFRRDREWLGIFQVRSRLMIHPGEPPHWPLWSLFTTVWLGMISQGLLIESFDPKHDQFARYLLTRLANRCAQ